MSRNEAFLERESKRNARRQNLIDGDSTEAVFSYGTLQEPQIQFGLWGEHKDPLESKLYGYELTGRMTIYPNLDESVIGSIYFLTPAQLAVTDEYEHLGSLYSRDLKHIQVPSGTVEAWVYVPLNLKWAKRGN